MTALDHLKRAIGPLERRVRTMLMRATLTGVDDAHDLQQMQVTRLEGEVLEECERVGQYGLASVPPLGAEVIVGQIGGNADHQVVLGVDDRSRPHPLTPGQTVIYDASGTKITLDAGGNLIITASGILMITAPTINLFGDVEITGNLGVSHNVTIAGTLNGHAP